MDVEQVTEVDIYHGEGPCWWPEWGGLRFVDMLAGDVLSLGADGAVTRDHVGDVAAVIRPRRGGGAIVATKDDFCVTDGALADLRPIASVTQPDGVRLNEGGCDPDGRFYCGSMAYDETPDAGVFYRLEPDGQISVVADHITVSNGFDFSPDGTRAYYIDSRRYSIDVFDYEADAGLTNRRVLVRTDPADGAPDGLVVDAEGGVWVAMMGSGAVVRYSPDGARDALISTPVPGPTACTFGGPDLRTLYITTSKIGIDVERYPASGALYSVQPGVAGRPALAFAG